MKAKYVIDEGDVTVIRPAVYLREKALRDFSYEAGLPVINENCPACFEAPKERNHVKKLLAREESVFPSLYSSMRHALTPLFDPAAVDVLTMIRENIDARNGWNARRVAQRAEAVKAGKCERGRKDIAAEVLASEKATELNGTGQTGASWICRTRARRSCWRSSTGGGASAYESRGVTRRRRLRTIASWTRT